MSKKPGRIITFYSYKGGVGRTMSLVNVAWLMANNGKRVLIVDWDLEAPGLNRYLVPFLKDPDLTSTRGLVDLLIDFQLDAMTPNTDTSPDWYNQRANVKEYVARVWWDFPSDGRLDLLGAGRQGPVYFKNLVSFDWARFYERFGGGAFLNILKERMKSEYDYVLIDSRTGVNDIAGICTMQMADDLVVCVTPNMRSIEGGAAVAASVMQQRERVNHPLRIFPVPVRVDTGTEFDLLERDLKSVKRSFCHLAPHLKNDDAYWRYVSVPYLPYFAYDEIPAAFARPSQSIELLGPAAQLIAYLTGEKVSHEFAILEDERRSILDHFKQRRSPRTDH